MVGNKGINMNDTLKKFKLKMEDSYPKKYVSPSAGKVSFQRRISRKISTFWHDVWTAIKEIYREIM
jgi:hypothetical protein